VARVESSKRAPRSVVIAIDVVAIAAVSAVAIIGLPSRAGASSTTVVFQGSSSAYGVRLTETVPNGPLSSTLLDGGGPTAQAQLDSIGGTHGYAAFPDPGPFIISLPGLAAGLMQLPTSLPQYPLQVSADQVTPKAEIGAGVYDIKAAAADDSATATAAFGVDLGVRAALSKSTASVTVQDDGSVIATATSDLEGFAVGPLTIGQVRSTATKRIDKNGKITTTSDIKVNALAIGGIVIPLPLNGLNLAPGVTLPISLTPALEALLASSKITIKTLTPQQNGNTITAPAVEVDGTIPSQELKLTLGTADGSYSLVLGQASATMIGTAPPVFSQPPASGGVPPAVALPPAAGGVLPSDTTPLTTSPPLPTSSSSGPAPATSAPPSAPPTLQPKLADSLRALSGPFGVSGTYFVVAMLAVLAFLIGHLVRTIGVRGPWTSSGG
jgi:hypothetical protein